MNSALYPDVIVNGELVPHMQVATETQNHEAPKGKPGIAWRKAANAVAIRTLLLQEARSRRIMLDPNEVGPGRFETEEEALIRGLLEQAVDAASPTEADIRAEWERDPTRFRAPPLWEVSHILCACDPRDKDATAMALIRATALLATAKFQPKRFAALAASESDCGSKSSGGTLGQLGPGDTVPEFEAALRTMAEGEVSPEPVLTRHGYHIIRIDARAEGAVLPFETVHDKIANALEKTAWARAARTFTNQLVAASKIEGADLQMV